MSNHTCTPCLHSTSFRKPIRSKSRTRSTRPTRKSRTRFDFKGSDARVEHGGKVLTLYADDDFKLSQVTDILAGKLTKRGVDIRRSSTGTREGFGQQGEAGVTVRVGIEPELSKAIVR